MKDAVGDAVGQFLSFEYLIILVGYACHESVVGLLFGGSVCRWCYFNCLFIWVLVLFLYLLTGGFYVFIVHGQTTDFLPIGQDYFFIYSRIVSYIHTCSHKL